MVPWRKRDRVLPLIVITSPSNGNVLNTSTVLVTGTASDNVGVSRVETSIDGQAFITAGGTANWSVSYTGIPNGNHTISARAFDAEGNVSSNTTVAFSVNIAAIPPSVSISSPVTGTSVLLGSPLTILGVTTNGTNTISRVEIDVREPTTTNGMGYIFATTADSWAHWKLTVTPTNSNFTRILAKVTDVAGLQAFANVNVVYSAPPPPPPTGVDKFGIKMIYPTVSGGREYYMNMAATTMTQLLDGGMIARMPTSTTRNSDGSWQVKKTETPRWVITTPSGAVPWRNVEMTGQFRLDDPGSGSYLQMYCRGEQHSTDRTLAWHGSANKCRMRFDGAFGFIREFYHETGNSGYSSAQGYTPSGFGNILGKWITWKFVCYNIPNTTNVKLEAWIDLNGVWKKVFEYTDSGTWNASSAFDSWMASQQSSYPAYMPKNRDTGNVIKRNERITWAGQFVSFRSDNSTYSFKNVSVREIRPPTS